MSVYKFDGNDEPTDLRNLTIPKQHKHKENHEKNFIIRLLKTNDEEDIESSQREKTYYIRRTKIRMYTNV